MPRSSINQAAARVLEVAAIDFGDGQVRLFGGAGTTSDYIKLPDDILGIGFNDATFEFWATRQSVQSWGRIFDFGGDTNDYFVSTWSSGTNGNADRVESRDTGVSGDSINTVDNSLSPFTNGQEVHLAFVVDKGAGPGGKTLVSS